MDEKQKCEIDLDKEGKIVVLRGYCKASDLKKESGGLKKMLKDLGIDVIG